MRKQTLPVWVIVGADGHPLSKLQNHRVFRDRHKAEDLCADINHVNLDTQSDMPWFPARVERGTLSFGGRQGKP